MQIQANLNMYSYFPFSPPFTKTCVYVCVFFYILLSLPKDESGDFSPSVHGACPFHFREAFHWVKSGGGGVAKSCPILATLWTLTHQASLSFHGISQASILKRVATLFSRGSSQPRDRPQVSCSAGRFFASWATRSEKCCMLFKPVFTDGFLVLQCFSNKHCKTKNLVFTFWFYNASVNKLFCISFYICKI